MNQTTSISRILLACAAALMLAACSSRKLEMPAHQAIAEVENALNSSGEDGKKLMPEQYNEVLGKLNALKTQFNHDQYEAVIAGAPAAMAAVKGLADAIRAKKNEEEQALIAEWPALKESVPAFIADVQRRGIAVEKSRKPPEGVDIATARRYLQDADVMWKQAKAAEGAGRISSAVLSAKKAQQRATTAAKALKMELPPA